MVRYMHIPDDLKHLYNHCLDLSANNVEKTPFSPEMILALIERIAALETDSKNPNSYIHQICNQKLESLKKSMR